ncbi:hypothetical protein [Polaromonas sp. CG9_12]|nr:hypothetical protein [Polaromonas sp. CG9_12]
MRAALQSRLLGGADEAIELDACHAIEQGMRVALALFGW